MKTLIRILFFLIICVIPFTGQANEEETIVCPGRGERCAYVKILGIKIWQKKTRGGPGVIVKTTVEE